MRYYAMGEARRNLTELRVVDAADQARQALENSHHESLREAHPPLPGAGQMTSIW